MGLALCRGIRQRYPEWKYLLDGDGGDENLKDYPIEENPELTIRSVLNNRMLYQEGWGVDAIKHSLTYSGGLSRGYVRTYAPARASASRASARSRGPAVIAVAEAIPFIELTGCDHERLYALKGEIVARGRQGGHRASTCRSSRSGASSTGRRSGRLRRAVPGPARRTTGGRSMRSTSELRSWDDAGFSPRPPSDRRRSVAAPRLLRRAGARRAGGAVEDVATLLSNRECPFRCLMCDLWKNTTTDASPDGAVAAQIEYALARLPPALHVKLYNAGNFFDAQAIPPADCRVSPS